MATVKTQTPLMLGENYIYPLTTADQVILADGTRLMKNGAIAADNASKIGGYSFDALKAYMLDLAHPVGSYYWSSEATNPSALFGGSWERIKDQFILAAGDSYSVNNTGGNASVTLTTANMPAHTHTRGTMNITGTLAPAHSSGSCWYNVTGESGAFYTYENVPNCGIPELGGLAEGNHMAGFDASRSWTGETSSVGSGQAFDTMPPYLVAYCWRRTA